MPISMEKHLSYLKAAATYRAHYNKLYSKLNDEVDKIKDGDIKTPLLQYVSDLRFIIAQEIDALERSFGPLIEVGLLYYTPAKLQANERSRKWQRESRGLDPNRPLPQQSTIMNQPKSETPRPIVPQDEPLSTNTKEQIAELLKKYGA